MSAGLRRPVQASRLLGSKAKTLARTAKRRLQGVDIHDGVFDGMSGAAFSGWLRLSDARKARIQLRHGAEVVLETTADVSRPEFGDDPASYCAFAFSCASIEAAFARVSPRGLERRALVVTGVEGARLPGPQIKANADEVGLLMALAIAARVMKADLDTCDVLDAVR